MSPLHLTYCGNVHPAEDLEAWCDSVARFSLAIAATQPTPFGLGAYWSASTAEQLAREAKARDAVRALLDRHDLTIWTLNVFPFGGFSAERVKDAVYRPDWASEERLTYTLNAAEALAGLLPSGATASLSTLPLGFRSGDRRKMARNLARAGRALADLEQRSGVHLVLALEPEPFCLLETVAQTAEFFEQSLFAQDAWALPEDVLRRHLGVCIDLCHLAVVGEDPLLALADLAARNIRVPKIQVSSCLEVRRPATALGRLLEFDEPRYLHQTVADDGRRALDLAEVRRDQDAFARAGRIRTHFHMPVFWDEPGAFGSTRAEVERVLQGLGDPAPMLEVETYTWSVLEDFDTGPGDLVDGIVRELAFVRSVLQR